MNSLANRLALVFFLITLGAMAIVYVGVVPTLESSLASGRSSSLRSDAQRFTGPIRKALAASAPVTAIDQAVRNAADQANARVTLLGVDRSGGQPYVKSDSNLRTDIGDLQFPAADVAIQSRRTETATESSSSGRVVEAAVPLSFTDPDTGRQLLGDVLVYSAPLGDVEHDVALVRNRILIAGILALAAAVLAGFLVAHSLGRRVERMEGVAIRVAHGDFSARFPVDRDDELGRLARALDAMQRQLAELDTARRRFIATASHELRTPIFSLGGFLELLEDEDLDEETRGRFLAQLREQVDRLGKLATDLLDLSRLDAGAVELRPEETDVGTLARTVADEFVPALAAHESRLEVRLTGEPVMAVCDPERLAQIMRILIDNALSHTDPGTDVVVATSLRAGRPRIAVTDFGPGIARQDLPRVFEPFYTSDGRRGSGLGLAIAHELAERMGGELGVESLPGRTTFSLEIPA
ncbi:MAG TPA: HAMP domain-containing sensor histidine kinase [Solirubrobacteraceae bacterium]|nr:HAMP domain-containing sensor histidine kinase [Solirubrobacteraceae bacterium]